MSFAAVVATFVLVLLGEYLAIEAWLIHRDRPMCVRGDDGHWHPARSNERCQQTPRQHTSRRPPAA